MIESLLMTVLDMSFVASIAALVVMLLRFPLKKAPKIFSYALWAVVIFRLLCPFSFESAISIMPANAKTVPHDIVYTQMPVVHSDIIPVNSVVNRAIAQSATSTLPAQNVQPLSMVLTAASWIWLAGIAAMLVYSVISYIRLRKRISEATLLESNVYESDRIISPFVMGIWKPRIYLPTDLANDRRGYIIAHERTHISRKDYLIKPFAFAALALHWFNPIIWLSYLLMCKDMELSCDESVIARFGSDIRKDYSQSLLSITAKRSLLYPLAFGESHVKSRVKNVLSFKKPTVWIVLTALCALLLATVGLMSNRKSAASSEQAAVTSYDFDALYSKKVPSMMQADRDRLASMVSLLPIPQYVQTDANGFLTVGYDYGTSNAPYTLTVHYTYIGKDAAHFRAQIEPPYSEYWICCRKNALILMSLMDDLQEVAFVTHLPTQGQEPTDQSLSLFTRTSFAEFGDSKALWEDNHQMLHDALTQIELQKFQSTTEQITLADIRMLARKGDALTVQDFAPYHGYDPFFGVYGKLMNTVEGFSLIVSSAGMDTKVMMARLAKTGMNATVNNQSMDIRYDDIDAYIAEDTAGKCVDQALEMIMSSPAIASNPGAYIAAHQDEYDAIVQLDYNALPKLTEILSVNNDGLKDALAAILMEDIFAHRIVSSYMTPGISATMDRAKIAYRAYTGHDWVITVPTPRP